MKILLSIRQITLNLQIDANFIEKRVTYLFQGHHLYSESSNWQFRQISIEKMEKIFEPSI